MSGHMVAPDLNGTTHALQFQTHDLEKLSPEGKNDLAATIGKTWVRIFSQTNAGLCSAHESSLVLQKAYWNAIGIKFPFLFLLALLRSIASLLVRRKYARFTGPLSVLFLLCFF